MSDLVGNPEDRFSLSPRKINFGLYLTFKTQYVCKLPCSKHQLTNLILSSFYIPKVVRPKKIFICFPFPDRPLRKGPTQKILFQFSVKNYFSFKFHCKLGQKLKIVCLALPTDSPVLLLLNFFFSKSEIIFFLPFPSKCK